MYLSHSCIKCLPRKKNYSMRLWSILCQFKKKTTRITPGSHLQLSLMDGWKILPPLIVSMYKRKYHMTTNPTSRTRKTCIFDISNYTYPEIMGSLLICISKMAASSSQKFLQRFLKEIFCSGLQAFFWGEIFDITPVETSTANFS